MKRQLILAASIALTLILVGSAVLAANFWTSTSVHKTITINTAPILDGAIRSVESFSDYGFWTVPTDFPENYDDVRDNSFLVGINNTNVAGDVNITISATGVPPGMVVTAKMGYAAYYYWMNPFDYQESHIDLFFENETSIGAYVDTYDGVTTDSVWANLNMSNYLFPTLTLDTPYTIPAAHVAAATLSPVLEQSSSVSNINYCNGLWLQFQFDTSGVSDGTYNIGVTVSLDPA